VINKEVSHLSDPERMELIPAAAEAIRRLNQAGFLVIAINQPVVAHGGCTVAGKTSCASPDAGLPEWSSGSPVRLLRILIVPPRLRMGGGYHALCIFLNEIAVGGLDDKVAMRRYRRGRSRAV
jgi:hypothetical protein